MALLAPEHGAKIGQSKLTVIELNLRLSTVERWIAAIKGLDCLCYVRLNGPVIVGNRSGEI